MNTQIQEMLAINERQRVYYEHTNGSDTSGVNNWVTNLYRGLRSRCFTACCQETLIKELTERHKQWIGDLRGRHVLELGAGSGSHLSIWLAQNATEYHAVDLSAPRLNELREKLEGAGVRKFHLHASDFLENQPDWPRFDVIYARAVMHHFRHLEPLLDTLHQRLTPGGMIVTLDPLQTWWPARLARMFYRPFQSDSDWEHPFTQRELRLLSKEFQVEKVQGLMGRVKWALPLALAAPKHAAKKSQEWRHHDLERMTNLRRVQSCLQISMMLREPSLRPA